jgi:hypothetical protein
LGAYSLHPRLTFCDTPSNAAQLLVGKRFVSAEFMYRPRPSGDREQRVFDFTLKSRLSQLGRADALLLICDDADTIHSLLPVLNSFPQLDIVTLIANPNLATGRFRPTPQECRWSEAERWQRYVTTDRWARINTALTVAGQLSEGYLLMPAHDAVWSAGLLPYLVRVSERYGRQGMAAAVSPYPYWQHSLVPGADIAADVTDLLNTCFARDSWLPLKFWQDAMQAFWGKMSLTPFALCKTILEGRDAQTLEDDLEIDRVIRAAGYGVRCCWVSRQDLYRQALPVFDESGIGRVIERTLHYSLNIPGEPVGGSSLNVPLDWLGRVREIISPRFRRYNPLAEALIMECSEAIAARLHQFGVSWVDWGRYRYVVRVGDPHVEVWRKVDPDSRMSSAAAVW